MVCAQVFVLQAVSLMLAGPLRQYWHVIGVVLGVVIILLGILRLLGLLPRISLNAMGRIQNPVIAGVVMILIGGGMVALALVIQR